MKRYFVYILQCKDGSYYTSVTNDVERWVFEHQNGLIKGCYTHNKRPVKLALAERFDDIRNAIEREKQIKGWSRSKKEVLISGDYGKLPKLSKNHSSLKGDPSTSSG
ncbi:MAG: GIY-YIG nuclease family protein [Nitrospinales bacterium]